MATAQQLIVDAFVDLINNDPNLTARVIASSPHPGILRVTTRNADEPRISYLNSGSSVTGTGTFAAKAATGSPQYAELWFSWTLAPGDTVKINAGSVVLGLDLTYNLPPGTTVDVGGFDHTGYTPGGSTGGVAVGGSGIGSAAHRRLVVMECGSASSSFGAMFALDPQDATGVAIPTFRVVTSLPTAGSSLGEAVYVTATRQGYVWDGVAWRDVTASPIRSFANDALLQADTTEPIGAYAVASDTGNMYVRTPGGWRRIGISEFATYADMLAYNAPVGSQAVANDLSVVFLRIDDNGTPTWQPVSTMTTLEADILATQNIEGLQAVSTDTGRTYVNDGTRWIEQPIRHYDTEAELLADTPPPNTLAWANDTAHVFTYANNAWLGLNTGMDDPIPLGAFMDFPSRSIPNGWLECNGQVIPADAKYDDLRTLLGTANVPDLRGLFARAANDGQTLLGKIDWTTGRPKTNFTTSSNGNHTHNVWSMSPQNGSWWDTGDGIGTQGGQNTYAWRYSNLFQGSGDHTHSITGGGDTETAPDHVRVVRCIKAFHITQARPAPDTILSGIVAPQRGEALTFDLATSTWRNGTNGEPPGTITQSLLNETEFMSILAPHQQGDWVLADGRDISGSRLAAITGMGTAPDLRGAYLRMAGTNGGMAGWDGGLLGEYQDDTTRRPRHTSFTTNSTGSHSHTSSRQKTGGASGNLASTNITAGDGGNGNWGTITNSSGSHSHTITGGGDAETRPKSFCLNYFVKIN